MSIVSRQKSAYGTLCQEIKVLRVKDRGQCWRQRPQMLARAFRSCPYQAVAIPASSKKFEPSYYNK